MSADAYQFLMRTFKPGDRVYVFGFSRGAYICRALCGMLHIVGLLTEDNEALIPYAIRMIKQKNIDFAVAADFKKTFSRDCKPHVVGVWDTVSSVGWVYNAVHFPFTTATRNPDFQIVRHAMSIDERRAFFRQNLLTASLRLLPKAMAASRFLKPLIRPRHHSAPISTTAWHITLTSLAISMPLAKRLMTRLHWPRSPRKSPCPKRDLDSNPQRLQRPQILPHPTLHQTLKRSNPSRPQPLPKNRLLQIFLHPLHQTKHLPRRLPRPMLLLQPRSRQTPVLFPQPLKGG